MVNAEVINLKDEINNLNNDFDNLGNEILADHYDLLIFENFVKHTAVGSKKK
jgi:hypothetical protein